MERDATFMFLYPNQGVRVGSLTQVVRLGESKSKISTWGFRIKESDWGSPNQRVLLADSGESYIYAIHTYHTYMPYIHTCTKLRYGCISVTGTPTLALKLVRMCGPQHKQNPPQKICCKKLIVFEGFKPNRDQIRNQREILHGIACLKIDVRHFWGKISKNQSKLNKNLHFTPTPTQFD